MGSKQNNSGKKNWDILQNIFLYVIPQKEKSYWFCVNYPFNIVCLLDFPCVCNLFADRGVVSMSSANLWTPCQQMPLTVCILKQSVSLMVRWWRVMSGMDTDTATPPATAENCIYTASTLASPWAPTAFTDLRMLKRMNINTNKFLQGIYSISLLSPLD